MSWIVAAEPLPSSKVTSTPFLANSPFSMAQYQPAWRPLTDQLSRTESFSKAEALPHASRTQMLAINADRMLAPMVRHSLWDVDDAVERPSWNERNVRPPQARVNFRMRNVAFGKREGFAMK